MTQPQKRITLENFDDAWGIYGEPVAVEKKLFELLSQAEKENSTAHLEILSQIALAQALQKRFDEAHDTLNKAESLLTSAHLRAYVRIFLERGRAFQQAGNLYDAKRYFEKSYELSAQEGLDVYTIDAAHMIAIISENTNDKIHWNQQALEMAQKTNSNRAQLWLGSLTNNLGQNYLDAKMYDKALSYFQQALEYRKKESYQPNIRVAEWAIGKALRYLGRIDEAINIQTEVLKKYEAVAQSGKLDCPEIIFTQLRGYVYEELSEIHQATAQRYAQLALKDLAHNEIVKSTEQEKLNRLKKLASI